MKALLIGEHEELMMAVPSLLNRAGFTVDVISTAPRLITMGDAQRVIYAADTADLFAIAAKRRSEGYDLTVIADDLTLYKILTAQRPDEEKLALLPVVSVAHFIHLCSKVNLAVSMAQHGIASPPFNIAQEAAQLMEAAGQIGYPLLVKTDFSGGGVGVVECRNADAISALVKTEPLFPLLVQKKIAGVETDLSAFFLDGNLVHFSHSSIEATVGTFAPSSLRRYSQLGTLSREVFDELQQIGKALGLHGFTNISCIASAENGQRYYFEVDVRPNVWVNYPRYIGDDPAMRLAGYWRDRQALSYPQPMNERFPAQRLMPYPFRLAAADLALNRYQAWRYIDDYDWLWIAHHKIITPAERFVLARIKPLIAEKYWRWSAKGYHRLKAWSGAYWRALRRPKPGRQARP